MSAMDFAQLSAERLVVCAAAQWVHAGDGWPHPVHEARVRDTGASLQSLKKWR